MYVKYETRRAPPIPAHLGNVPPSVAPRVEDSTDPRKWGSSAWHFLHCMSSTYPAIPSASDKNNMKNFIRSFAEILPCQSCRTHFSEFVRKSNLDSAVSNGSVLSTWFFDAHNHVNLLLHKTRMLTVDYDRKYPQQRVPNPSAHGAAPQRPELSTLPLRAVSRSVKMNNSIRQVQHQVHTPHNHNPPTIRPPCGCGKKK